MSIQLLDKTRKLNRLLKNAESSEISFSEISKVLKEMLQSNVLVLSKKGKVLGVSHEKSFDRIEELLDDDFFLAPYEDHKQGGMNLC